MEEPTPIKVPTTYHAKPRFTFLGMTWCPHCVIFGDGGQGKPAQWPLMLADKELNAKVELKRIEWNNREKDHKGQPMKVIPRPPGYDFANYGPFFLLEAGSAVGEGGRPQMVGMIYKGQDRTAAGIKKWIFSQLASNPLFKNKGTVATVPQKSPMVASIPNKPATNITHKPAATISQPPRATPVQTQPSGADRLRSAIRSQGQQQQAQKTAQITPPLADNTPPSVAQKKVTPKVDDTPNFRYRTGTKTRIIASYQ